MKFRFLRFAFVSLVAVIAIAMMLLLSVDLGRFKAQAENFVSDSLQREFSIAGPLHLTLGRKLDLSAEGVSLASTDGSAVETLISIRRLEASIDFWSLLDGPIRVEMLNLEGFRGNLEKSESGNNNWSFGEIEVEAEEDPAQASTRVETSIRPKLPVLLDNFTISDAILIYQDPELTQPLRFVVETAEQVILESRDLQLKLHGDLNDTPLNLNLRVGKISNLIEFSNVAFNFDGRIGEIKFSGVSDVADLLNPRRPIATVSIGGPNIEYLTDIVGLQRITTGPLKVDLSLGPIEEGIELELDGTFGEFAMLANGQFKDLQELQEFDLKFSTSGPNTGRIAALLGVKGVPQQPFYLSGNLNRTGPEVSIGELSAKVGDTNLSLSGKIDEFPKPETATLSLQVDGKDIGEFGQLLAVPGKIGGPFNLNLGLAPGKDGTADVSVAAKLDGIEFDAQGVYRDGPDLIGSNAQIKYRVANLNIIATALDIPALPDLPANGSAQVERIKGGISIKKGLLDLGKDQFQFDGAVGDDPLAAGTKIQLQAKIIDLPETLAKFGMEIPNIPAGNFTSSMQINVLNNKVALRNLEFSVAGLNAELEATLSVDSILDDSDIKFRFKGEDLSALVPPNNNVSGLDQVFDLAGAVGFKSGLVRVSKFDFKLGENRLKGELETQLEFPPEKVQIKATASGPELFRFSPRFAEFPLETSSRFDINTDLVWEKGLLSISKLIANIGDDRIELTGHLDGPPNFERTDLKVNLNVKDVHYFGALAGQDLPHESVSLQAQLRGDIKTLRLDQFDARLGESDLSGDFVFHDGEVPQIDLKVASKKMVLTPYLPPPVLPEATPDPDTESRYVRTKDEIDVEAPISRIIPDTPLPIELLQGYTARVDLKIDELQSRENIIRDFSINFLIEDGALRTPKFELKTDSGGELSGKFALVPEAQGAKIGMRLFGRNLDLGLPAESSEELQALPHYDVNVALHSLGNNPRELAAALNGYVRLTAGEGRVKAGGMAVFTQDFMFELLNTVNPLARKDPYAKLECVVLLATMRQGKVLGKPFLVVKSERLNIFANINVDLGSERLDASITTVPQKGLGLSLSNLVNPFVKVGGSLSSPYLALDPEGVLLEGGAAVATGGLSILAMGLKDRFLSDKDPCGTAIKAADEEFEKLEENYKKVKGDSK
jgi:hypothetical protein